MALETLKGIEEIGGFEIGRPSMDHDTDKRHEVLSKFIIINEHSNCINFRIQNGPIKEVGVNGCQVDTLIEAAKLIVEGLNKQFPCRENSSVITKLEEALLWSMKRKLDREKRQVEGLDKP